MNPFYRLFSTNGSFAPTVLRLVLAAVFAVHGGQKTIGWMSGDGWYRTLEKWTAPDGMNLPYWLCVLAILTEVTGAFGMFLGLCTRPFALGLLCVMVAAILLVHLHAGFLAPAGFEYPMTLGGIALSLVASGGGRFSIDRALTRQLLPPNTGVLGAYKLHSSI